LPVIKDKWPLVFGRFPPVELVVAERIFVELQNFHAERDVYFISLIDNQL
jgi:hypothetical protein